MRLPFFRNRFPPRTESARRARAEFDARYTAHEQELRNVALSILVWGASLKSRTKATEKRWEILNRLADEGHAVLFSEDLPGMGHGLSLGSEELAQAMAADVVIVLLSADSIGAIEEVARICTHPEVVWKAVVFAPTGFKSGFMAHSSLRSLDVGYRPIIWYTDEELQRCEVVRASLDIVAARRDIYAPYARHRSA